MLLVEQGLLTGILPGGIFNLSLCEYGVRKQTHFEHDDDSDPY